MVSQLRVVLATILCLVAADGKNRTKCVSTNATCWPTSASFAALNRDVDVVLPGDKAWASAIKIKNPRLHIVPGAVVMANNASDVVLAIKYAAAHDLEISIKSTGHCYSGNCMGEGSLHLDLTRMGKVSVDTASMEMTTEPGTNFKAMYEKADNSGVLVVGGMCPTVGPVGYALGGGHGTKI